MYWYRSRVLFVVALAGMLFTISDLSSCKPDIKETGAALKYFDLKGYFERDSARLTKLNKPVFKTVVHNGVSQSKKVRITNWGLELSMFKLSDINKPAWRDSYSVVADSDLLIYRAKYPDLVTREIIIKQVKGKVKYIVIYNYSRYDKNYYLYMSHEKLSYFPDSLYLIDEMKAVRIIGINRYQVKGVFNQ